MNDSSDDEMESDEEEPSVCLFAPRPRFLGRASMARKSKSTTTTSPFDTPSPFVPLTRGGEEFENTRRGAILPDIHDVFWDAQQGYHRRDQPMDYWWIGSTHLKKVNGEWEV